MTDKWMGSGHKNTFQDKNVSATDAQWTQDEEKDNRFNQFQENKK